MRYAILVVSALTVLAPVQSASQSAPVNDGKAVAEWSPAQKAFIENVQNAIVSDDAARISQLFKASDAASIVPVNANIGTAREGATFLDYAAVRCKANAIEALIANGGDPNTVYSSVAAQDARTLSLAAATCREIPDNAYIRRAISALFSGQKRANPNPVDALSETIARPQFHAFIEDCQRFNPTQGYLTVTEEWIRHGLDPGASATPAQGGVTALHVVAADPMHPVCKDIALALAKAASEQDFLKRDNKNRIPVDYTFGPARKQSKNHASGPLIDYWIDCFALADKGSLYFRHQNQILNAYLSRNNAARDLTRACGKPDGNRAVVHFGADKQGRKYLWQARVLPGNDGSAAMDDPPCDAAPGNWSSCQYLSAYPSDGRYELTTDYKLVWKELDSTCTQFDSRKVANPVAELGFRECDAKCGHHNAIYFDGKFGIVSVGGKRRGSRTMRRVAGLYKNWTGRARCIGLLVYLQ